MNMNHGGTEGAASEQRAMCYRCNKPQLTCICAHVRSVPNRTRVWVAQHFREQRHSLGTARIVRLGLDNVHVEVLRGRRELAPPSLPSGAGLLFPGAEARDLAALPPAERPEALVVIDGTWSQAHALHRDHPWLQQLPHYRLTPEVESRYRLRKEPSAECMSTIEAIVQALRILEPHTPGLDGLLASFDAMIDQQIALIAEHRRGPRQRRARRSRRGVPLRLLGEPERLVAVGLEAAPRGRGEQHCFAIVQCVALRVATGEVFQHFVQPPAGRFPTPYHLVHMGLSAALLQGGSALPALRDAWEDFVVPDDLIVAWNKGVLDGLDAVLGLPGRRLHLKSAYRSHAKQRGGSLGQLIEQLRLEVSPPPQLQGRAGEHVAQVVALLEHMQALEGQPDGLTADVWLQRR